MSGELPLQSVSSKSLFVPHLFVTSYTIEILLFVSVKSVLQLLQRLLHLAHAKPIFLKNKHKYRTWGIESELAFMSKNDQTLMP